MNTGLVLRLEQLSRPPEVEGVSLTVAAGEQVALVGSATVTGAVLRWAALLSRPQSGRIFFEDTDVTGLNGGALRQLRQRLQFMGSDPQHLLPVRWTVREALGEPLKIHHIGTVREQDQRAAAAAAAMGLSSYLLTRRVNSLSPALCQRAALARALTLQPRLLICAGPVDTLEPAVARPLLEKLAAACHFLPMPAAWLWSTSQPELAAAFADRVLVIENGQIAG